VPPDARLHNLSDGIAYVGLRSNPRAQATVFKAMNGDAAQLSSDDGTTFVRLNPTSQVIAVTAPGGITLNSVTIDKNGNMNAPGNILSQKTVTGQTDVVTGANTSLNNHLTSGVSTGTGTSGKPVAGT
jgi:hypothetical protein